MNSIQAVPIRQNIDLYLAPFFEDIIRLWYENQGPPTIEDLLQQKKDAMREGKIEGIFLLHNHRPVGIAWSEEMGPRYGSKMLHTLDKQFEHELAKAFVETGIHKGKLLELVPFYKEHTYSQAFKECSLCILKRQRLARYLDTWERQDVDLTGINLEPLKEENAALTAEISIAAHHSSFDQYISPDMSIPEYRIELEKVLFAGKQGKMIADASLMMTINNQPVGICSAVEIACWGFEKVPWVFDMCILPSHHKKGLGKKLFISMMNKLKEMGYPIVGLAVTHGNKAAEKLYFETGFFHVEDFEEFGYPQFEREKS